MPRVCDSAEGPTPHGPVHTQRLGSPPPEDSGFPYLEDTVPRSPTSVLFPFLSLTSILLYLRKLPKFLPLKKHDCWHEMSIILGLLLCIESAYIHMEKDG